MIVLHFSFIKSVRAGGIHFYIKNLVKHQQNIGINSNWISSNSKEFNKRVKIGSNYLKNEHNWELIAKQSFTIYQSLNT